MPVSPLQCYLSQFNTVAVLPCPFCIWNKFWNSLSVFSRTLFRFNDSFFLSGSLHRRLYEYYTEVQFECAEYMELYGYEKMTFSQFVSTFSFQDGRLLWFDDLLESGSTGRAPKSRFRISIHSFRNYLFTSDCQINNNSMPDQNSTGRCLRTVPYRMVLSSKNGDGVDVSARTD